MTAPQATAGLVHLVLGVISTADTWRADPTTSTLRRLTAALGAADAAALGHTIGECLVPLRHDEEHLALALDLIRAFDFHEAWPGLVALIRETPSAHAVTVAAAMAPHPAVPPILADLAQMAAPDLAVQSRVRALLLAELDEAGEWNRLMFAERWPGKVRIGQAAAPLVVVAGDAGAPADELHLLLDLRQAGAHVRRVPPASQQPPQGWIPDWAPAVVRDEPLPWMSRRATSLRTGGSLTAFKRGRILRRLQEMFRGSLALRRGSEAQEPLAALAHPLIELDIFFDGALRLPEARYLVGWSSSTIRRRASEYPALAPAYYSIPYFDFAQLTAMRVEAFVQARAGRRASRGVAVRLLEKVKEREQVPAHVLSNGEVLFEEEAGTLVDAAGQTSAKVFHLDQILESFTVGGGHSVPALFNPSDHTTVHPSVQRGTPSVKNTRIPALAVHGVLERGRRGGREGAALTAWARNLYPFLSDDEFRDADEVGAAIVG